MFYDEKKKIEQFMNDFISNFQNVFYPFENLARDEMVI